MKKIISVFVGVFIFANIAYSNNIIVKNNEKAVYKKLLNSANEKTLYRFSLLDKLIEKSKNKNIVEKLMMTNSFVNRANYLLDKYHWRKNDYWATPYEFISTGAGDSEDFALTKYYILMLMGIDEDKLKLMVYHKKNKKLVKYQNRVVHDPQHIVLAYFHKKDSLPIILDTIDNKIFREHNLSMLDETQRTKFKHFDQIFDNPSKCKYNYIE
jgi:predicted transglutaminase-like cysteine proteinase